MQKNSHTHITFNNDTIDSINIKQIKSKSDRGLAGFFGFLMERYLGILKN